MKYFVYRLLVSDEEKVYEARGWCKELFGEIPIVYVKEIGKRVYDKEKAQWLNKLTGKYNRRAFYFKNADDAMAFKLRWT